MTGTYYIFSGFKDTILTVGRQGTYSATYVDVVYHSGLGLDPVRYYFDANFQVRIPVGDLVRAYLQAGYAGGIPVTLMTVTDDADTTSFGVNVTIVEGIPPVVADDSFPPRTIVSDGGISFNTMAYPDSGHSSYSVSYCYSGTWTTPTTEYSGSAAPGVLTFEIKNVPQVPGNIVKVGDWQCVCSHECVPAVRLSWKADIDQKTWVFEVTDVVREVTDTSDTASDGVLGSTLQKRRKAWTLKFKLILRGLEMQEAEWFSDLVTGEVVSVSNLKSVYERFTTYFAQANEQMKGYISDKKSTLSMSSNRRDLTFELVLFNVTNI